MTTKGDGPHSAGDRAADRCLPRCLRSARLVRDRDRCCSAKPVTSLPGCPGREARRAQQEDREPDQSTHSNEVKGLTGVARGCRRSVPTAAGSTSRPRWTRRGAAGSTLPRSRGWVGRTLRVAGVDWLATRRQDERRSRYRAVAAAQTPKQTAATTTSKRRERGRDGERVHLDGPLGTGRCP